MIDKKEIERKSKEFQINSSDIQRDYLFGWLLHYVFNHSRYKDLLFLKGGNALRKGYFIQTRFSKDLDFGTPYNIDQAELEDDVKAACKFISERSGIQFVFERNVVEEKFNKWQEPRWQVFEVRIYFKDFYGNSNSIILKVSLDVTRFDKTYLPIQTVQLLHPYSDSELVKTTIRCMKLEEVLATKLKCMLQREHAPDLFDFIYSILLNTDIPINKYEVRSVFLKRTIFESNPSMAKKILLKLPLEYLKAVWAKSILYAEDKLIDVEQAIKSFTSEIESLFADVSDYSYKDHLFFGPDLRNAILRAGRTFTVLRVIYDGVPRMVEPYSLKFMERSDGVAREYLYVWDRVGGRQNPGVKMFLPDKIRLLENTEEPFQPRDGHEVELSKQGEYPEKRYLYDKEKKVMKKLSKSKSAVRSTRTSRTSKSYGPKHVYKCNSCGKLFYRKRPKSSLQTHKNKNGSKCYGYAIYQGMRY